MKAFILGASGLVGSHCLDHFRENGWTVEGSHRTFPTTRTVYYDGSDPGNNNNFDIISFAPDVIIHCAALTNVDYCETHENESYDLTVKSTQNICEIAKRCRARVVYISTDYVFNGENGPYSEEDEPNPVNVYGRHKLLAEKLVSNLSNDSLLIRVTNIYGNEAQGKNFIARLVRQYRQNDSLLQLKLPFDQFATPINAHDIARAIYQLTNDKKTGIYHLASTDYMSRFELAARTMSYMPNTEYLSIQPVDSKTLAQVAKRPLKGGLSKIKFTTDYPTFIFTGVDSYILSILKTCHQ